ncbi:phosphate regulon sensor histidine kinase PhoR [Paucibacter sp. PLA-PC-4]|uniref:phosphate regulon sensor histidine kinase PhoR n=1 Tax=Paucibacter sp. PLA-PC-4 TaxID=2993655 RepID=UPI0022497A14|nr:phosphate regulon sensor histidine kinase PhoR [Paucibacter sp. PLA-PC-4]MCX2861933.1 phosphate regulon sensor histidine kinase PhoR [Paucibacter sp. PLA-PC-4]
MNWLLPRIALATMAVALGALVGVWVGRWSQAPFLGEVLGAGSAVLVLVLVDSLRGHRLIHWLRGNQQGAAPRDTGFWGELGYRIERAVRERERVIDRERLQLSQFLSAIEASPNGVLMLDRHDHIQWCNKVAADHFALDPQRDLQQRITNLVRSPAFVGYLQSGQYAEPLMLGNTRGPGNLSVVVRSYGEGMRLVLSQDVTERERAESMRRDFVANVSHEIRTPLTVLTGFIETMSSLPLTEAERKRVLFLMGQQTQRMLTLVSDLLTLAQLEGSPRPAPDRWVSLDGLLNRVASDAQALSSGRHQISVQTDTHADVAGVEPELLSAAANLVTNAVRYTPDGGAIDVAWRLQTDGSGELSVCDTGPGIAREHLPRLTERFYRVDGSRSRETGGTGLGLSIVKHVVQRHGGELHIQSEPGKGSKFRLVLPAVRVRVAGGDAEVGVEAAMPRVQA